MALMSTHHILLGRFLHLSQVSGLDSWRSPHTEVLYICSSSLSHRTSSIFWMGKEARHGIFTWEKSSRSIYLSAKQQFQNNSLCINVWVKRHDLGQTQPLKSENPQKQQIPKTDTHLLMLQQPLSNTNILISRHRLGGKASESSTEIIIAIEEQLVLHKQYPHSKTCSTGWTAGWSPENFFQLPSSHLHTDLRM